MKIICLSNEIELTQNNRPYISRIDSIIKDKEYAAYGMILFQNELQYIVNDEFNMATWYPSKNFKLIDNEFNPDWLFQYYGDKLGIEAIWGYEELVNNPQHYKGLIEKDEQEIKRFMEIKNIDK